MPSDNGSSGPTTTHSTLFSLQNSPIWSNSETGIPSTRVASVMPSFPGNANTSFTLSERFNARTIACSRPPLPITKVFIYYSLLMFKVSHTSCDHRHIMCVTVINRILVTLRSTWLNNCVDACFVCDLYRVWHWEEPITCHNDRTI